MPSRITLTPMDVLIGPQATSFPALSIASLGSNSVMIQIRTFDPVPPMDENAADSSSLQRDGAFTPGPLIAGGIILTLTYVPGPSRVKPRARARAPAVASAPTVVLAPAPASAAAPSSSFAPPRPRPLSRQPAMAFIPSTPGHPPPRLSLRPIQPSQQALYPQQRTPMTTLQRPDSSSASGSLWIWFFLWLVSVSTSFYFIAFHQKMH